MSYFFLGFSSLSIGGVTWISISIFNFNSSYFLFSISCYSFSSYSFFLARLTANNFFWVYNLLAIKFSLCSLFFLSASIFSLIDFLIGFLRFGIIFFGGISLGFLPLFLGVLLRGDYLALDLLELLVRYPLLLA